MHLPGRGFNAFDNFRLMLKEHGKKMTKEMETAVDLLKRMTCGEILKTKNPEKSEAMQECFPWTSHPCIAFCLSSSVNTLGSLATVGRYLSPKHCTPRRL